MSMLRIISTAILAVFFVFGNASFAKDKDPKMISVEMPAMYTGEGGYLSCTILNRTGRSLDNVEIQFHEYDEVEQMWEIEDSPFIGSLANGYFHRDNDYIDYNSAYCRFRYLGFDNDNVSLSMCFLNKYDSTPVTCFSN